MNIDVVAAQVRTLATVFNGNVAGAAAYANAVQDSVWLPMPAAYVIPLEQEGGENESQNGIWQIVRERVGVIIVVSTLSAGGSLDLADRRAQAAAASIDTYRAAIFKAMLNWRPDWDPANPTANREARGFYFVNAGFPEGGGFDRARFVYQYMFGLDRLITDADGWQLPYDYPVDVQGTITSAIPPGDTLAVFDVSLRA